MPLYMGEYNILPEHRGNCMTFFATMNAEMDAADAGKCKMIGRWSVPGEAKGFFLFESPDAVSIGSWLQNWITMATCVVTPVVTENELRKIAKGGEEPSFKVDDSKVAEAAPPGYTLFFFKGKMQPPVRADVYGAMSGMTKEQALADAGDCIRMGVYHNPGRGEAFGVAAAKSSYDVMKWMYNWCTMCEITTMPVMLDGEGREMIASKPGHKLNVVKAMADMNIAMP
jgi:hypothetical protein